ncbi:MAG: MFS transporter [Anaerolineae bacterium]
MTSADTAVQPAAVPHDPLLAWRYRDFRLVAISRFAASLGEMMVSVAIGWEIYERSGSAFALGLVGLVQVLPIFLLSLPAGHIADRYNRKRLVLVSQAGLALVSLGLALVSFTHPIAGTTASYAAILQPLTLPIYAVVGNSLLPFYLLLFLFGVMRAFNDPASSTLLAQSVPPEVFGNAATWGSSAWQLASVLGPAFGGLMVAHFKSGAEVYLFNAVFNGIFVGLVALMRLRPIAQSDEPASLKSALAGFQFLRKSRVLLAAITLDLFAVLFGGATALLPVFAKDILHVGPEGLGWMRTAPSIGALLMVVTLAYLPPFKRAGKTLLLAVAGFGIATIIFGLSRSFVLSMLMLITLGALDNISVVVRSTLLLTRTPDEMRGRVAAVNTVFISGSNEMGAFESGVTAALFGPIGAVIFGGIGTLVVVGTVAWFWPEMRALGKLVE